MSIKYWKQREEEILAFRDYVRTASTSWAVSRASLSISHRQHIVGTLTIAYR